jgi:plasmid maintenance system antidote protein VapI
MGARVERFFMTGSNAGISADMSLRLSAAFGTHAEISYELQTDYDMGQASRKKQPKIEPFSRAA